MSLKISLGGDIVHYLGAVGLLNALSEKQVTERDDLEIHCSGFSCIPLILWTYQRDNAYSILSSMWGESLKFFKGISKPSLPEIGKNFMLLYKMQKKIDLESSRQKLSEFVEKWIPNVEIEEHDKIKIHAFNLEKKRDEILHGNAREVLIHALPYPIDFAPVDGYISSSWVLGIPEGDGIIYIDWYVPFEPRRATDYLLIATFARVSALVSLLTSEAKVTVKIPLTDCALYDFKRMANRFYLAGKELVGRL
uniref:Uncharacterized protein n=1 Tax=Fervidobacterium pennivorans TaxID=93466 RepID=A0A832IL34_FERPE